MKKQRLDIFARLNEQLPIAYEYERATIKTGVGLIVHIDVGDAKIDDMQSIRITERFGGNATGRSWVAEIVAITKSINVPASYGSRCYDIFYKNAKEVQPFDRRTTRAFVRLEEYDE